MDRPTCATCKWWNVLRPHPYQPGTQMRMCMEHCQGSLAEAEPAETSVVVFNDEHTEFTTNAGFFTGPAFGCVHHERVEVKS